MRARRAEHRRSEAKKAAEGGAAARPRSRGATQAVLPGDVERRRARCTRTSCRPSALRGGTDELTYLTLIRKLSRPRQGCSKSTAAR